MLVSLQLACCFARCYGWIEWIVCGLQAYRSIFQDVNEVEFGSRSILALSPDPDEWGYIQVIGDGDSDSDSESNLGVEDHLDVDPARRRSMYQKSDHKKDIDELMKLRSGLRFAREYRHSNVGERQGRRARGENKEVSKKSALVPTPRKPVQRHVQYTYAPHVNANCV